jgi:hypothetical protein
MTQLQSNRFQLVQLKSLSGKTTCQREFSEYYDFWKTQWGETYRELIGLESISSDEFFRQDEFCFLRYGREIVGCVAFNEVGHCVMNFSH